jgi:hypothetical protein
MPSGTIAMLIPSCPGGPGVANALTYPTDPGLAASFASGKQLGENRPWNVSNPLPVDHLVVVASSLDLTTFPLWSIRAQNATVPAIDFGSSFLAVTDLLPSLLLVTAPLRRARVPMLPAGMLIAA